MKNFLGFPFGFGLASYDDMMKELNNIFGDDAIRTYRSKVNDALDTAKKRGNEVYDNLTEYVDNNIVDFVVKVPYCDGKDSAYHTTFDTDGDGNKHFMCYTSYSKGYVSTNHSVDVVVPNNCNIDKMKKTLSKKDNCLYFTFPREFDTKKPVEQIKKTIEDVKENLKENIDGISEAMLDRIADKVFKKMQDADKAKLSQTSKLPTTESECERTCEVKQVSSCDAYKRTDPFAKEMTRPETVSSSRYNSPTTKKRCTPRKPCDKI